MWSACWAENRSRLIAGRGKMPRRSADNPDNRDITDDNDAAPADRLAPSAIPGSLCYFMVSDQRSVAEV